MPDLLMLYIQTCIKLSLMMKVITQVMDMHMRSMVSMWLKALSRLSGLINVRYLMSKFRERQLTSGADVSLVTSIDDHQGISQFFEGFALNPKQQIGD